MLGENSCAVSTLKDAAPVVGCFTQWCMFILLEDAVYDCDDDVDDDDDDDDDIHDILL